MENTDSPSDDSPSKERLENFLDGLMNDADRAAFAEALRDDPQLERMVELQRRIDGALRRTFQTDAPTRERLAKLVASEPRVPAAGGRSPTAMPLGPESSGTWHYWAAAAVAAAALIAWVIVAAPWNLRDGANPHFAARPLADIYRQAVASGFEPSYDCREPERFAAAFQHRQGQPLRLEAQPDGVAMLGLAYVGGLSRNTTAMLCRIDGAPVMVFVDRASSDQAVADNHAGDGLRVFREERDGLVFYEVTPLEEPRAAELIVPLAADAASGATL